MKFALKKQQKGNLRNALLWTEFNVNKLHKNSLAVWQGAIALMRCGQLWRTKSERKEKKFRR